MPDVFDDTKNCKASFYLDEWGHEITKQDFILQLADWAGVMLYIGGGYCPLQVAVLTTSDPTRQNIDESSAVSAMEEWARRTGREEEIGEDEEYDAKVQADPDNAQAEYELVIERIPQSAADIPSCDQCRMTFAAAGALKGNIHEKGCPNDKKTWIRGRGWVRFYECSVCGCDVEEGETCTCFDE